MKLIKTFEFTIVLKNLMKQINNIEDHLYEAGCDDALVHFRHGVVYLDFDREASSFEEAVISAIKNIRSIDLEVASVTPDNLVTESEIAKRSHVTRQTVSLWIKGQRRQLFPPPAMHLAKKSVLWRWDEVAKWLFANKIISDNTIVEDAIFLANINAALEECDAKTLKIRRNLLQRISVA